jgi:hypothetical protein
MTSKNYNIAIVSKYCVCFGRVHIDDGLLRDHHVLRTVLGLRLSRGI